MRQLQKWWCNRPKKPGSADPSKLGEGANVLVLFDLECFVGKQPHNEDTWHRLTGSLSVVADWDVAFGREEPGARMG